MVLGKLCVRWQPGLEQPVLHTTRRLPDPYGHGQFTTRRRLQLPPGHQPRIEHDDPTPGGQMQIGPGGSHELPAHDPTGNKLTHTPDGTGHPVEPEHINMIDNPQRLPHERLRPPPSSTARACNSATSPARSAAACGNAARTARFSAYGIRSGTPSAARSSSSVRRAAMSGPAPSQLKQTAPCSSSRAEPRSTAVIPTLVMPGPNHAR